jgi:hypothetical protein
MKTADPVQQVSADLAAIIDMAARIESQAVNHGSHPLMPGGLAMVSLAPVPSLREWERRYVFAEHAIATYDPDAAGMADHIQDEDDAWEPPLQTLLFWSEQWRAETGADLGSRRPTLLTEASFLRWRDTLDWAWRHETHWQEFADDINTARVRLEDMLCEGDRADRTRVTCDREGCARRPQLIRVYGATVGADEWKCPACKARYTEDDRARALARQLRSEGAERFVQAQDARSVLATVGRAKRTVRKWTGPQHHRWCRRCKKRFGLADEECTYCRGPLVLRGDSEAVILGYCDMATHATWLWWPDLWRLHLTTPERKRTTAA